MMHWNAGWHEAARWIDKRALEEGIDLGAEFDSPEDFARSLWTGCDFTAILKHFSQEVRQIWSDLRLRRNYFGTSCLIEEAIAE